MKVNKWNFTAIRNLVDSAYHAQEAGEDNKATELLEILAEKIKPITKE